MISLWPQQKNGLLGAQGTSSWTSLSHNMVAPMHDIIITLATIVSFILPTCEEDN